jgi:hypothetical protein
MEAVINQDHGLGKEDGVRIWEFNGNSPDVSELP